MTAQWKLKGEEEEIRGQTILTQEVIRKRKKKPGTLAIRENGGGDLPVGTAPTKKIFPEYRLEKNIIKTWTARGSCAVTGSDPLCIYNFEFRIYYKLKY